MADRFLLQRLQDDDNLTRTFDDLQDAQAVGDVLWENAGGEARVSIVDSETNEEHVRKPGGGWLRLRSPA